jgi:hypothetical protein
VSPILGGIFRRWPNVEDANVTLVARRGFWPIDPAKTVFNVSTKNESRPLKPLSSMRLILLLWFMGGAIVSAAPIRSPANQVFQFVQEGSCTTWADGSTSRASAFLWIPEQCQRVRGLVVLCANVPEHRLVGHEAIRAACAAYDLGIVWCVPSFMNFRKDPSAGTDMAKDHASTVAFFQTLLDGLAARSGYDEVARVPWLPIGESAHLLMVDALVEYAPERCLAGVWLKNNHLPPTNRTVPALVIYGTAQEWAQDKTDIRTNWSQVGRAYDNIIAQRRKHPQWALSYILDGSSGHFDCSEELTGYMARYIRQVAKARLPSASGAPLPLIATERGVVAGLAAPGRAAIPATGCAEAVDRALPWYFDLSGAEDAQAFSRLNWSAETQLPGFVDASGRTLPFMFNGISSMTPEFESDGISFTLHAVMLDRIPENFVDPGLPLARAAGKPELEWLCGPIAPLGGDRFQVALDRSWPSSASYVAARQTGDNRIRSSVQPCAIRLQPNHTGLPQTITFAPLTDVKSGIATQPLSASSSAGLRVRFYVVAGPATIDGDSLVFTKVPPRTKFPVTVTVAAWQWGRGTEPKVQSADIVQQSFHLLAN